MARPRPTHALGALPLLLSLLLLVACGGGDGPTDPDNGGGNGGGATPTGTVSGTVVDAAGAGIGSVTLRLARAGASTLSATTNASGAFSFASVPTGTWTLSVVVPAEYELASGTADRSVNVTDGGTATQAFTLERFEGETINIVDNAFQPQNAEVAAGTEVRWRATTSTFHTVTPDGHDAFSRAETNSVGTVLRATFGTPGTYDYFCEPHRAQGMEGSVRVN